LKVTIFKFAVFETALATGAVFLTGAVLGEAFIFLEDAALGIIFSNIFNRMSTGMR